MELLAISLIAITSFANSSQDKTQKPANSLEQSAAQTEVENELKRVAALYKAGDFIEAQRHAEKAVSLDPSNLKALTFLARVEHQRYKPGVQTLENIEQARASIATYQRLLALDWENEEAYKAVAVLYAAIHEDQLLEGWILQRASNPQFPNEKRAEGYAVLAGSIGIVHSESQSFLVSKWKIPGQMALRSFIRDRQIHSNLRNSNNVL